MFKGGKGKGSANAGRRERSESSVTSHPARHVRPRGTVAELVRRPAASCSGGQLRHEGQEEGEDLPPFSPASPTHEDRHSTRDILVEGVTWRKSWPTRMVDKAGSVWRLTVLQQKRRKGPRRVDKSSQQIAGSLSQSTVEEEEMLRVAPKGASGESTFQSP